MLLMPHKKKIATIIVGSAKEPAADFVDKGSSPQSSEPSGSDESYAYEQMAQDMIHAVSSKDAKRLASVLKDFYSMCNGAEESEELEE